MITAWPGDGKKAGQSRWLLRETNWQEQLPQASSCASVQVCVGTERSNLKVRSISHSGRFQRVGYTVGLWEVGSEQIGASVSYNGDGLSFKKLRSREGRTWAWGMT